MRIIVALAILSLVASCQTTTPEMTSADRAQVEAEVNEWADGFLAAFADLNPDKMTSFWTQDGISSVSFARRMTSSAEMADFYDGLLSGWTSSQAEWMPGIVIDVISPTTAVFQGSSRQATTNSEGVSLVQLIHFTHYLKKVDGAWKIQMNHVSGGDFPR